MRGELFLNGSAYGAGFSANAAFDALVGIDFELAVTFRNRFLGAFSSAGTASDAFIRNFVSHYVAPPIKIVFISRREYDIIIAGKTQVFPLKFVRIE